MQPLKKKSGRVDWQIAKAIARDTGIFRGPVLEYPPLLLWYPVRLTDIRRNWEAFLSKRTNKTQMGSLGIFVNMLFCKDQCLYCDYINVVKNNKAAIRSYLDRIHRDIKLLGFPRGTKIESLYVSGGNLADIPPDLLERLFGLLSSKFNLSGAALRTVGLSHTPISKETAKIFRRWKINRAVIQLQSIDNRFSQRIRRGIDQTNYERGLMRLREAGISYVKADWMVGIREQSINIFQKDLEWIIGMGFDDVVITPFNPGRHPPLGGLENLNWKPRLFSMKTQDIIRRAEMLKIVHKAIRGKARPFSPWVEKVSTVGLGHGALSHIYGRLKYTFLNGEARVPDAYGVFMDIKREMRAYVVRNILDCGWVDAGRVQDIFGLSLVKALGKEVAPLVETGLLVKEETGWRVSLKTQLYCRIAGACLYEDEFKDWFRKRMKAHPQDYALLDNHLLKLYNGL